VLEHPSVVSFVPRARGPGTSRVPEPAPLRMRSRRGLRARPELLCVLRWKDVSKAPAPSSPDLFAAPCVTRGGLRFLRARSRVSGERVLFVLQSSRSSRCVRSTSALRNRPYSSTRLRRRFPAQRSFAFLLLGRCLAAPSEDRSHFRSLSTPCPPTRTSLSRAGAPVRRRARWAPGSSGPPGADETGEIRASRRVSHFGAQPGDRVGGVFFHRARPCRSPLTPLSPPSPRRSNRFRRIRLCLQGRQDRFRVCPVKSNRIPDRERLPSDSRSCAPRARRGGSVAA